VAILYKICTAAAWREAQRAGSLSGTADDLRDGFIHLSTPEQVAGTLARHFAGQRDLMLLAVAEDALRPLLRWEPARGGALFPHLYGVLPVSAVQAAHAIAPGPDGQFRLPETAP
jgi:uncharacterized protein (DUF952 family)